MTCGECQGHYSSAAAACIHCGAPNQYYRKPIGLFGKLAITLIALFICFIGFGAFLAGGDPTFDERSKASDTISYCESEYKRLQATPGISTGALRIASGACEKLKADYRSRWNREP